MKKWLGFLTIAALGVSLQTSLAQAPAGAPSGSTGMCNDGSYWTGATKQGACRGHKGVKDWYGSTASAPATPTAATSAGSAAPPPPAPAAAPPAPVTAPAATSAMSRSKYTPPATAAPGGGAGMVWANKNTKVYHCQGDRYYGKTKNGAYMTEADAKAQSYRPDHNKPCQ